MILSHKIRLDPTYRQVEAFNKACGCARYAWNWALSEWEKHYREEGGSPSVNELKKRWNREKPAWVYESPKDANLQPFAELKKAYSRFFKKTAKAPKFKARHRSKKSFYISNDKFYIDGDRVRIPVIGWVRMAEQLRYDGRVMRGVVSERAGKWYISISVEVPTQPAHGEEILGIDLGLKTFATLSTGEQLVAPEPLKRKLKKLRRLSRQHAKKQRGSMNRKKSALKLAKHHAKVTDERKDWLHKATSRLVSRAKILVLEDLSLSGMTKLWGRKLSDLSLHEFRRQLAYKCEKNDVGLVLLDRFFPSTQLCSSCGVRKKMKLSEREYVCPACGFTACRDFNAALNIVTEGFSGIYACGHESEGGYRHQLIVTPSWLNQELNRRTPVRTN